MIGVTAAGGSRGGQGHAAVYVSYGDPAFEELLTGILPASGPMVQPLRPMAKMWWVSERHW